MPPTITAPVNNQCMGHGFFGFIRTSTNTELPGSDDYTEWWINQNPNFPGSYSNISSGLTWNKPMGEAAGTWYVRCAGRTSDGSKTAYSQTVVIYITEATKLVFVQQPSSAVAGATISPGITVQLKDNNNVSQSQLGIPIEISLFSGTGVLSGTLSQTTNANGLATFDDLGINQVTSKELTVSSIGLTSAVSIELNIYAFQKNGVPISPAAAAPVLTLTKL